MDKACKNSEHCSYREYVVKMGHHVVGVVEHNVDRGVCQYDSG